MHKCCLVPFHGVRPCIKPMRAVVRDADSFQAKVLIETLEHTCNKLIYDPKREYAEAYRMSIDLDDADESIALVQLVMITCVGIGLCLLAQRK
jgi:hypothetical protein